MTDTRGEPLDFSLGAKLPREVGSWEGCCGYPAGGPFQLEGMLKAGGVACSGFKEY